jgi:hypothetical protein
MAKEENEIIEERDYDERLYPFRNSVYYLVIDRLCFTVVNHEEAKS